MRSVGSGIVNTLPSAHVGSAPSPVAVRNTELSASLSSGVPAAASATRTDGFTTSSEAVLVSPVARNTTTSSTGPAPSSAAVAADALGAGLNAGGLLGCAGGDTARFMSQSRSHSRSPRATTRRRGDRCREGRCDFRLPAALSLSCTRCTAPWQMSCFSGSARSSSSCS
jgi:hypothetical protein